MLIRPVYRPRLASLNRGLINRYPLGGRFITPSRAFDVVGSVNGIVSGSAGIARVGGPTSRDDASLLFSATNDISFGNLGVSFMTLSLTLWFKTTDDGFIAVQLQAGSAEGFNQLFYMCVGTTTVPGGNTNQFNSFFRNDSSVLSSIVNSGVTVNDGKWHHLATVWNGNDGGTNLHVDGRLVASTGTITGPISLNHPDDISHFNGSSGGSSYRDFRIYNRVLDPGEVLALYAESFQPQIDIETIGLMASVGGAPPPATVDFRRTLSALGARVGSRQGHRV